MQVKIILILLTFGGFAQIHGDFAQEALKMHNEFRGFHGCPALSLDQDLSTACEEYAKTLSIKGVIESSSLDGYTENLCITRLKPVDCITNWYNERVMHDYSAPRLNSETEHFTALIWKASTKLGIGLFSKDETHYVVARYKPKGNIISEFKENVPVAKGKADRSTSFGFGILFLVSVLIQLFLDQF
ncbi:Golgi-associated plant pathogenesis-related protein 1-like [Drosophila obscura]|uniref:Golgi-associated plant pathogenesis-related protein 1-like n=1 Tax=Drosophila obscura TaxID=7282 RepID=UPI001BB126E7|nr:Golgi-associated plant pathogenesis-related protein 1-like [Drosophila obscura]